MSQKGNVDVCPITKEDWEFRAAAKRGDCGGQSVYHCLTDDQGGKWERCVEASLIKKGNCPIFTNKGFVDWKPCNMSIPTCPKISYFSNEVYKYSLCFGNNSQHGKADGDNDQDDGNFAWSFIGVGIGIILLIVLTFLIICMRRKRFGLFFCTDPDTKNETLELQKLIPGGVSKEFVKRYPVISGLNLLSRKRVRSIVVVGKLGNSVFSTSHIISEVFKNIRNWESLECRYTNIPNAVKENTILYVYGWFGMWNDNLCSAENVKKACQSLLQILKNTSEVKIIVGMRSDLYKKYQQVFWALDGDVITSLFYWEIYLDTVDVRKDAEYIDYFKKHITEACEENACACKMLTYSMLQRGKDKDIGIPLKLNIIKRYHEIIPCYLKECDILKVMGDHFKSIEKDGKKRYVYEWIMYICLKGKFRSDEFDTHLVKEMKFEIEQSDFDMVDVELCRYIRIRNSDKMMDVLPEYPQYVFWHPFIYICAFHFLFHKNPELVIKHCNVDAILELVRPLGYKTSYFEVTADNVCVALFYERIRSLGKKEEYACHPLFGIGTEIEEAESIAKTI